VQNPLKATLFFNPNLMIFTRNVLTLCRMDFIAVLLTAGVKLTNTLFLLLFLQSRRLNVYSKKS
jgi:hypothetical protein